MNKLKGSSFTWIWLILLLAGVNLLASMFHTRIDLTEENRYTLSSPTRQMLANLQEPVNITIFLSGEMPAGFKKLAQSTGDILQEFQEIGKNNIQFSFEKPGEGLDDSLKIAFIDSLQRLGLNPMNVKAQVKEGEGQEERYLYPGALVSYAGRAVAVNFLQGQSAVDGINSLNNAEALLEYKLASAIHKISSDTVPLIGYLSGNGESLSYNVYDLINTLKASYNFRILPIDEVAVIPPFFSAILIVKPTKPFADEQKLKIDQYIMNGGKVMWMVDNLYAEFDSLQRSQNEFIAFDRGLNIEDQLFRYGVRVNPDLVQDLRSDQVPSVIGNIGDRPQIELVPWPYFPLLSNTSGHPVAKNLDYVLAQFANSIDTVKSPGVNKTILLSSSADARVLSSPAKVSWNSVQSEEDIKTFTKSNVPVAVLLEGTFSSLYTNRLSAALKDSLAVYGQPFLSQSTPGNKMIVVSDGDIALNAVTQKDGPLSLGRNMFTDYQYANKEFVFNCIEYLTDESNILEARSKDFTLRLLDKGKLEEDKTTWQFINILVPIVFVSLFGAAYHLARRRKYQA